MVFGNEHRSILAMFGPSGTQFRGYYLSNKAVTDRQRLEECVSIPTLRLAPDQSRRSDAPNSIVNRAIIRSPLKRSAIC